MAHNYLKKIAEIWDQEKYPPDLYDVTIAHDDWCAYLDVSGECPGECNCDPDVIIKEIGGLTE